MVPTFRQSALVLFALLWFANAYVHQPEGWNEDSRLALLHAVAYDRSPHIDRYAARTGDRSFFEGHYYSDKAPGTAVAALPAFLISAALLRTTGISHESGRGWQLLSWGATAGSVSLLSALGCVALFLMLAPWIGRTYALISALVLGLGSLPFAYGGMLMAHAATFGLLSIALWLSEGRGGTVWPAEGRDGSGRPDRVWQAMSMRMYLTLRPPARHLIRDALTGFISAFAVAGEYTAGLTALCIMALASRRSARSAGLVLLGALPAILLIPLYNYTAFHSVFSIGYNHLQFFERTKQGFFGITLLPHWSIAGQLLFGEYRGLIFWTPFLLLAFPGIKPLWQAHRLLGVSATLVPVAYVLLISTFPQWDGGWALSARHLTSALPFIGVAAAFGCWRFPRTGVVLAAGSMLLIGVATFLNSKPPMGLPHPIAQFYIPRIVNREFAHNLGEEFGLTGKWSFMPFACITVLGIWWLLQNSKNDASPVDRVALQTSIH